MQDCLSAIMDGFELSARACLGLDEAVQIQTSVCILYSSAPASGD
jgi:hypothetical protein